MRTALLAVLLAGTAFAIPAAAQQSQPSSEAAQTQNGPANLCQELMAYAEMEASKPPKDAQGQSGDKPQAQNAGSSNAPAPRADAQSSGTQGGGSVDQSSSKNTSRQEAAPTTTPVAPGAAPEPATSAHATDGQEQKSGAAGQGQETKLAGDITVQKVREVTEAGDRQACRDMAQTLRRAGAPMPATLLALAAYEPDPAKR